MIFVWFLLPNSGEPAAASLFIPLVCGSYLFAQAGSFEVKEASSAPRWLRVFLIRWPRPLKLLLRYTFLGVYLKLIADLAWSLTHLRLAEKFRAHLGLGLALMGIGYLLRSWHQHSLSGLVTSESVPPDREHDIRQSVVQAMRSGSQWYALAGVALLAGGALLAWYWQSTLDDEVRKKALRLGIATGILLAYFFLHWLRFRSTGTEEREWRFRPRPAWALTAKAVLCVIIALQLAYPVLANIPFRFEPRVAQKLGEICQDGAMCKTSRFDFNDERPILSLFSSRRQETYWFLSVLFLIVLLHLLEYEWIIRPYLRTREDRVLGPTGPARWDDWQDEKLSRYSYRTLAELTLPWLVYKNWLPVISVSVNLGFDRLEHRQVIQAMLVGLRERYHRTFLAWNSGFANLGRFVGILILLMLVALISGPKLELPRKNDQDSKRNAQQDTWLQVLNADLLPKSEKESHWRPGEPEKLLVFDLLPHSTSLGDTYVDLFFGSPQFSTLAYSASPLLLQLYFPRIAQDYKAVHFRVYHLLLFVLLFLLGRWLLLKVPLLPYKENLRQIEDLLDSLSVRTRITSSLNLWGPARWVYSIFVDERVREVEREPVDPRTVELAFLQILEDVQKGGFRFPGAARHHLTMPAPEITFVFDELDKLGTRVDPNLMNEPSGQEQETKVLQLERERSVKLRTLLSDLKNILSSAPARFVFVGGRDLHDEWLADQTSRQPLLTSIFNTEVYLPALMTDQSAQLSPREWRLHLRIEEYLYHQHKRAHHLHYHSVRKRWRPSFGLSGETLTHERFVPLRSAAVAETSISKRIESNFEFIDSTTGKPLEPRVKDSILHEFVLFLTHRSMGNPKKLKDLLASFVRPAARDIAESERWNVAPCRHVLRFSDTEIFRIQLLVNIYRHLGLAFEERMVRRDDKFAFSIFFLTDFLFKFHRRAFSWSNLERVDDLAHIHRLPDLRDLQEEIVNHFSERFLHRMLNGMYAFRFRSDIANEIEYLSRQSAAEMAAFNFTLDESQSLKAEYEAALKGREERNPDLVAAVGELYEFDQDFEQARYSYRRAIELLDEDLRKMTSQVDKQTGEFRSGAPIHDILAGEEVGLKHARLFLAWGSARLRLMLQIGMTFEHARTFEQAEAEYRNARTLARALIRAYVDEQGRGEKRAGGSSPHASRLHSLKHLNILFQPLFAEAWLSEKFVGAIDTSISLVERGLWDLRSALPFTRKRKADAVKNPVRTNHANFALTLSQLHNKAGDIYFFKGRQPVSADQVGRIIAASESQDRQTDGYLLRAHYHYAVGLHEIRRYVWQRVQSSPFRLSIASKKAPTLLPEAFPDALFRAAAGGVNDMAEATLARVSLFDLFQRLTQLQPEKLDELIGKDLGSDCEDWFASSDKQTASSPLANWFGLWKESSFLDHTDVQLIAFTKPDPAEERLLMSLKLCIVGASYFEKGGYPEDAGRELLQVCETVTRYLWWRHGIDAIQRWTRIPGIGMSGIFKGEPGTVGRDFWIFLLDLAIYTLEKADALFRESRHEKGQGEAYRVGRLIPTEALTLLCSLGISGDNLLNVDRKKRLGDLLERWTGRYRTDFWEVLHEALHRHVYPMINRLHGMKVLIDTLVLSESLSARAQVQTAELWQDLVEKVELRQSQEGELWQALEWTNELLDLSAQYDAPLHFTPLHSGTTCALLWLRWTSEMPLAMDQVERIYRAAQRDLHNSEEMYTMRRAYYEVINDLYYLYDDFNDRQIHFSHAIQMAGAELTAILKRLIDLRGDVKEPLQRA